MDFWICQFLETVSQTNNKAVRIPLDVGAPTADGK